MAAKQKIITIIEDNNITGTVYGTVEIDIFEDPTFNNQEKAASQYQRAQTQIKTIQKKRAENTKHK